MKEFREVLRDNSSLAMGLLLPLILILVIGYGISLDVKHAPIGVVLEDASPEAQQVVDFVDGSEYFQPTYLDQHAPGGPCPGTAENRCHPPGAAGFHPAAPSGGWPSPTVALRHGHHHRHDHPEGYVETAAAQWSARQMASRGVGAVDLETRLWFNDAHESTWYFLPGLILMIVTLVGVLLTAGVMAREYERGTFESLFVTPVKKGEIIVAR